MSEKFSRGTKNPKQTNKQTNKQKHDTNTNEVSLTTLNNRGASVIKGRQPNAKTMLGNT